MAASITALPPLTCVAKGQPSSSAAVFLLRSRSTVAVCFEACAGRRVRRLCPPAVACSAGFVVACRCLFCGLCACCQFCLPSPLPFSSFAPVQVCFAPLHLLCLLVHCHVRQDRSGPAVCQGQQFVRASSLSGPAVCLQTNKFASCWTVLLAAATRACSGGPCTGSILTCFLFPAESMILGHGLV